MVALADPCGIALAAFAPRSFSTPSDLSGEVICEYKYSHCGFHALSYCLGVCRKHFKGSIWSIVL